MLRRILFNPAAADGGNAKPDQADVLAQLQTANSQVTQLTADLTTAKQSIGTLTGQVTTLTGERDTARTSLGVATGDKTKLTAGATLPTDLVSAANEIFTLRAEKTTVEAAVAKRLAVLGIKDNSTGAGAAEKKDETKLTLTQKILAAQGCKTLAESRDKFLKATGNVQ